LSSANQSERIKDLINRLDHAYAKGLMSPQEYGALRHGLELRLAPAKRPTKKPARRGRNFRLKLVAIAVVAVMVLATLPFLLRSSSRPDFEITNVKLEKDTISLGRATLWCQVQHRCDMQGRRHSALSFPMIRVD